MRYRDLLIVWGMLVVTATGPGCAAQRAQQVEMEDLPAPVQATIRAEAPANARIEVEQKRVGNRDLFEVEMNDGLREIEILVDERGSLVNMDEVEQTQEQRRHERRQEQRQEQ